MLSIVFNFRHKMNGINNEDEAIVARINHARKCWNGLKDSSIVEFCRDISKWQKKKSETRAEAEKLLFSYGDLHTTWVYANWNSVRHLPFSIHNIADADSNPLTFMKYQI